MQYPLTRLPVSFASLLLLGVASAQDLPLAMPEDITILPTLVIQSQETANLRPVSTYETAVSNLEFDPRIDLQSRNMAEAQGDVTIRGGIFENTGFRIGSATLIDPQTGHYFAELPIAPEMLIGPRVYTGTDNALYGFNSTVGTVSYEWSRIKQGGSATVGGGNNDLNFQRLHSAWTHPLGESGEWQIGYEAEVSRSESDGTVAFSDHDFNRSSGRVQILGPDSQTDLFAGYQDKFFGQFGMYTGQAFTAFNPFETENLKTRLFILNHRQDYADSSYWETTAYSRRHTDHYIFNRFAPNRNFIHETEVHSLGLSGKHAVTKAFALNYTAQFASDSIESTNLENSFTSRDYYKVSLLPEYQFALNDMDTLTVRAGATYDDTNRNTSQLSGLFDITWQRVKQNGDNHTAYLSLSEASQVVGYTAIGGGTAGLFASDPDLDRESSQNLELGYRINRMQWSFEMATFYRWDDDLVDWTFESGSPNARTANNVDIETFGFELIGTRLWKQFEGIASYTYLHKDEDYGDPAVVGSFYALNFPEHRATLGMIWRPSDRVEFRLDNEWRQQADNALRDGPDTTVYTHLGASYYAQSIEGLEIFFAWDKPWDEDYQEIPGTPGREDQYSAGVSYRW